MGHEAIANVIDELSIQPGAIVSKVISRSDHMDVTVFAIDAGQGLTEHSSPRVAVVQVLSGRMSISVDTATYDAGPGSWLRMEPNSPHSLLAEEPSVMLLTLVDPAGR